MAKNTLGGVPFPPLVKLDASEPLTIETLAELFRQRLDGISICVRSEEGHPNRGGYFFHVLPKDENLEHFEIYSFEKIAVGSLPLAKLTAFINHCSGLAFDEEAFQFCQTVVNFRLDPEPSSDEGA